jgi:peptide chain release factor 1
MDIESFKTNPRTAYLAQEYERLLQGKVEAEGMLADAGGDTEMKELAQGEIDALAPQLESLWKQMTDIAHVAKEEEEAPKAMILEIQGGAGGDESSLFAAELALMYQNYAEERGWGWSKLDESVSDVGGYKDVSFEVKGRGAYEALRYETGVHRVQRIPETEKNGRVHTSTVTVSVMPIRSLKKVTIPMSDLEFETSRSGGAGGQNVNKVETAVRIIHKPTGIAIRCTIERSQLKNRERALEMLQAKLDQLAQEEDDKKHASEKKSQVGTGDRSEKIRTYNFPQDRVTDHRIRQSWHGLPKIMQGEISPIVEALKNFTGEFGDGEEE